MLALLLALIGLPVGFALDALVDRLAVPPEDLGEGDAEANASPSHSTTELHPEAGSLVLTEEPERVFLRRLLIVGATCGLFALAGLRYDDPAQLALVTAYICVLLICAATDTLSYRVPNVITYPAIVVAVFAAALMPGADITEAVAGGALAAAVLIAPALFAGGLAMGMGDVKLAAFVGLSLGFVNVLPALLVMALAGGVITVFLLATRLRKWGEPIPYAPFVSLGALAAMLWQGTAFITLN
jgi:prepilin signal peptidase PulO-like enzyme (type II secretory pathway)